MFERITGEARHVVVEAQSAAIERHDRYVSARHLAIALFNSADLETVFTENGLTRTLLDRAQVDDHAALRSLGIDLDAVRAAAQASFGPGALGKRRRRWPGSRVVDHIPFSPGAKRALELSLREVIRLGGRQIRAEHVALGVLQSGDPDLPDLTAIRPNLSSALESRLRSAA